MTATQDVIVPGVIIGILLLAAAAGGWMVGRRLSEQTRPQRRSGLTALVVIAVVSPLLHGAAVLVWSALLGTLLGYVVGRPDGRRVHDLDA